MSVRSYVNNTLAAKLRLAEAKRQLEESKAGREGQTLNAGLNVANVLAQQIPAAYKYSNDAALEEAMYNAQAVNLNPRDENGNPIDPVLNATRQVTPGISALDNKQAAMDRTVEDRNKVLDDADFTNAEVAVVGVDKVKEQQIADARKRGQNTSTYEAPPAPVNPLGRFNDDGTIKPKSEEQDTPAATSAPAVVTPEQKPAKDEIKKKYANDFDELYEALNGKKTADPAKLAKVLVNQVQQNNTPKDPIGKFVFEFFKIGGMDARTQRIAELQATKLIADRQATERSKFLDELVLRVKLSEMKGAAGKDANSVSNAVAQRKMEGEKIVNSSRSKLGDIWVNAKKIADPVARRAYVNKNLKEDDFPEGGFAYHSSDDAKGLVLNELDKEADEYAKNNKPDKPKSEKPEKPGKVGAATLDNLGKQLGLMRQVRDQKLANPTASANSVKKLISFIPGGAGKTLKEVFDYGLQNSAQLAKQMGLSQAQLEEQIKAENAATSTLQNIGVQISGTAISEQQRAELMGMIPNQSDSALGFYAKKEALLGGLENSFVSTLDVQGAAGNDVKGLRDLYTGYKSAYSAGNSVQAPAPSNSENVNRLKGSMGGG